MIHYVAVVGPGTDVADRTLRLAYEVGRGLAEGGAVVLTGGLGGVMAAAAAGAAAVGGPSVGLLPGADRAGAAEHLTVAVPTGLGELRNALLVRAADAVVCVGGSWGTLSEVALACRSGVPVVCIDGWRVLDADGVEVPLAHAEDAEQAVEYVVARMRPGR